MDTNFTFEPVTISVENTAIHPVLEAMGYNNRPDEFFKRDFDYFNHYYDKPIAIFENDRYLIITHANDYHALIEARHTSIDVYVASFKDEFNTRRFIGFRHAINIADRKAQYETIAFLQNYNNTEEGDGFFETIPGADINDKIGVLMGTSGRTVKRVKHVGDGAPEYLNMITQGEQTFQDAKNEIKKRKIMEKAKANPKKKFEATFLSSVFKELILDCSDPESPFAVINDKEFGSLELKSSVEIKDGKAVIKLVERIAKGLEIKVEIKHMANFNVIPFNANGNTDSNTGDNIDSGTDNNIPVAA